MLKKLHTDYNPQYDEINYVHPFDVTQAFYTKAPDPNKRYFGLFANNNDDHCFIFLVRPKNSN